MMLLMIIFVCLYEVFDWKKENTESNYQIDNNNNNNEKGLNDISRKYYK